MRIRLKGINSVRKKRADGSVETYYYAWKGGPRIRGELGSPEFIASYNEAAARKVVTPIGTLVSLLQQYQASPDFMDLADSTRRSYVALIKRIEKKFSDFLSRRLPIAGRAEFSKVGATRLPRHRAGDSVTTHGPSSRVLSWGLDRGLVAANPCERGGRLYRASRNEKIWTDDDEARFLKNAPPHLHLPLLLGLWTGQRQGDLLRLPWSAYDGTHIRLRQSKTGARVSIPVGAPLKAALNEMTKTKHGPIILTSTDRKPWTSDGFRTSWRKGCRTAGVVGVTFNDLRGTAVTRLALAGCTEAEIATITGHSLRDVRSILDAHYLHRDPALAKSAISKLERRTKSPN